MDVLCTADLCPVILNATCVFYEGNTLLYTGITTNDNLQTALQKIDAKFGDAMVGYTFTNGVFQSAAGAPVGLGGNLIANTTIGGNFTLTFAGNVKATRLVTTGGTASQFVKGDGTLDSTAYQAAGNYITALTGDVIAAGPGSAAASLAVVNSNPGTYGSGTRIPIVTVDTKGRVTALTTTAIVVPSGILSFVGDVYGSGTTGSPTTLTLTNVNLNVYTNNTFLKFKVNAKGLVTGAAPITHVDIEGVLGYVPTPETRKLSINGVQHDLQSDIYWTIATGVGSVTATAPLSSTGGASPNISITKADATTDGYLDNVDWVVFNAKQAALNGTGLVRMSGTTVSYDNTSYTPQSRNLTINGVTYDLSADRAWSIDSMIYPGAGIAVSTGTGWTTSIVDNSTNWNTAYTERLSSASSPLSIGSNAISISQAGAAANGYLSSTDWNTFNSKQSSGNYITSLTGEATATGPGSATVTLSTPAVTGKILTGVNITGGTVVDTDTILQGFGKLQNQINGLIGGSIYEGTWDAATNTPTLTSGVGTDGHYYIVNVAGNTNLNGITDWKVGDWAIFHGGVWQKVDNTDAVVSVNGYTGAVSLVSSDIPEGLTNLYYTSARARTAISLTTTGTSGAATYNNTTGVLNVPNYTTDVSGFVPYTGATANVNLGAFDLTADVITGATGSFASSGSGNTLSINHSSGSGIALNITKGGNGEGLYVNKSSGSGNAATIIGTLNATTLVKSGGTSAQFLKADGSVDSTAYGTGTVTSVAALTLGTTGTDLSSTVATGTTTPVITLNVPTASATNRGALSSADWTNFNNKTSNTGTVTSVGGTGTVSGLSLSGTVTTSGNLTLGGTLSLTSGNVTTALGFTPYNATNPSGFITSSGTTTGNVVARGLSNWNDATVIGNVVGMLAWKNYGNNHVIFDASNGTSPSGSAVNATNSAVAWTGTYPTLMGWNGSTTYGVRVDTARYADSAGSATDSTKLPLAGGTMTGTITITNTDIRSNSTSNWTGEPGTQGKIQYHANRWYIVSDSSSDRIVQFRRNATDTSWIANDGTFNGNITGNAATATTAASASAVAWGNVSSKPDLIMYYAGFTLDANTMPANSTGFTYSQNAPFTGPIARLSEGGYSLQFNAAYAGGGTQIAFRTRNGDAGTFNPWRTIINDTNIGSQNVNSASFSTYLSSSNYINQGGSTGSWNSDFQSTPAGSARYGGDVGANGTNGPGGSWWIQQNFRHTNGGNFWGTQVAWGWEDNANRLATRNVSANSFGGWVYYINSGGSGTVGGSLTVNGNITMGSGGASSIYMRDSDEGDREIHCNSNRIGFLTQGQSWGSWCNDDGSWSSAGNITSTAGNLRSNNWVYTENNAGWYNDTYGQGLRQAKANVTYGNVVTHGENFNGWSGYNAVNSVITTFMTNSSGTHGFYQENGRSWTAFYNYGNDCWGLGTDATDSAYSLHIIKYGGSNTGWIIWSDRRIKENIKTIDNALDKVLSLRGVYYNKIDDPNKERCVGYIAQEVMEVVPELVVYSEELDMYNMNYGPMVAMLTQAMKEQQAQIEELKQQVQTLLNS